MGKIRQYLFETCKEAIIKWISSDDIYAIGLLVLNDDDDLRKPTLRLVYNTHSQVQFKTPFASSELEARWNFAFWLWNIHAAICTDYVSFNGDIIDIKGISLRNEWIESLGLSYEDDFEENNFDDALELGGQINTNFDGLCISIAKGLHEVIQKRFGKDLPIIFYNREGSDLETITMTLEANETYLLDGFMNYLVAYCGWQSST